MDIFHRPAFHLKHEFSETFLEIKASSFYWVHLDMFHLNSETK
jgi:hypothetical protein